MKNIRLIVFVLLFPLLSKSQVRSEFWTKAYVENAVNKHWAIGVDIFKKTQNDYYENDHNLFHNSLTTGSRFWVVYKTKNTWQFLLSPFGLMVINDLKSSGDISSSTEFRITTGVSKMLTFATIRNTNRIMIELRDLNFSQPNETFLTRFRIMNRFDLPVAPVGRKNKLDYIAYNELFYKTQPGSSCIDQDRVFSGVALKHLHAADIIAGYQYTSQDTPVGIVKHHQLLIFFDFFI